MKSLVAMRASRRNSRVDFGIEDVPVYLSSDRTFLMVPNMLICSKTIARVLNDNIYEGALIHSGIHEGVLYLAFDSTLKILCAVDDTSYVSMTPSAFGPITAVEHPIEMLNVLQHAKDRLNINLLYNNSRFNIKAITYGDDKTMSVSGMPSQIPINEVKIDSGLMLDGFHVPLSEANLQGGLLYA